MSSLLQYASNTMLRTVFTGHDAKDASAVKRERDAGLPVRIASILGHPAAVLEKLFEDWTSPNEENAAERAALEERKTILRLHLQSASTFDEWKAAAIDLDEAEGNDAWKLEDESSEYRHTLVQSRLEQLDDARQSCDPARMAYLIRTSLARNLGGMGSIRLYKHSHLGTKRLVERYISSTLETISSLLELTRYQDASSHESRLLLEQILAARQAFGRSALLLSGGGTFGMSHIGVVKCLWDQKLLPRIVSGASAGSIVCSVLCVKTDDELPAMIDDFCYGDLEVFTRQSDNENTLTYIARLLKVGALFDVSNLTRVMKGLLGETTFQEAYNRTRRILNITVSSAGVFELPKLLNYITAPNVLIWSAVAASCSVPGVFSPAGLLAKDPRTGAAVPWNPSPQRWIDGSVDNDLPMTRLAEMFNVNHFIVSQVNPHVVPFLEQEQRIIAADANKSGAFTTGPGWVNTIANLAKDEALHRMQVVAELGILPNFMSKTRSVLNQKYSGDITILPEVSFAQLHKVLLNPTPEFMAQSLLIGQRATWPKLSRIQNHCAIELALDDAVQHLRARIAFSPSQIDLRLGSITRSHSRAGSDTVRRKRRHEGKRLRFSGEHDRTKFKPNSSRPMSMHERTVPAKNGRNPQDSIASNHKRSGPSPIFTTGSEADTESASSALSTPSDTNFPLNDNSYFPPDASNDTWASNRQLFPHASQPSTPLHHPRPPTPGAASIPGLSMTPSAARPTEYTFPVRSTNIPSGALAPLSVRSSLDMSRPSYQHHRPRSSVESTGSIPVIRIGTTNAGSSPRSSLEVDTSGDQGMLRRKRSTGKKLKALINAR